MQFFNLYQYLAPLILLPLSYWLWWQRLGGRPAPALLILALPILSAYIVPGIGVNRLGLWEFNTRFRLGKFRPHHGFVFGSAISLLAFLCADPLPLQPDGLGLLRAALTTGAVLGFINWLYDIFAVKTGFITVHNRPAAQNQPAESVVMQYAPVYFFTFGACYGPIIRLAQSYPAQTPTANYWLTFAGGLVILLTIPVLAYILWSRALYGYNGLTPYPVEAK